MSILFIAKPSVAFIGYEWKAFKCYINVLNTGNSTVCFDHIPAQLFSGRALCLPLANSNLEF